MGQGVGMISFRTRIILTDVATAAIVIGVHALYVAAIALVLGSGVLGGLIIGLAGGILVHRFMTRSIDADRDRKANRAHSGHKSRMASRRPDPFTADQD